MWNLQLVDCLLISLDFLSKAVLFKNFRVYFQSLARRILDFKFDKYAAMQNQVGGWSLGAGSKPSVVTPREGCEGCGVHMHTEDNLVQISVAKI